MEEDHKEKMLEEKCQPEKKKKIMIKNIVYIYFFKATLYFLKYKI